MFSFNFLSIALANVMLFLIEVAFVSTPIICIVMVDPKGFQECLQLFEHIILTLPKHIGQYFSGSVIDCMPKPSLVGFVSDETPHFIHFRLIAASYNNLYFNMIFNSVKRLHID